MQIRAHTGSSKHKVWQAVRASSGGRHGAAAPGLLQPGGAGQKAGRLYVPHSGLSCTASKAHAAFWPTHPPASPLSSPAAATYYLDDFSCGGDKFQDGAVTANNPAIIALQVRPRGEAVVPGGQGGRAGRGTVQQVPHACQPLRQGQAAAAEPHPPGWPGRRRVLQHRARAQEARLLWPDAPISLMVSLGSGSTPSSRRGGSVSSFVETGSILIESACGVERPDEALATLLPLVPGVKYFRWGAGVHHWSGWCV